MFYNFIRIFVAGIVLAFLQIVIALYDFVMIIILYPFHWFIHYLLWSIFFLFLFIWIIVAGMLWFSYKMWFTFMFVKVLKSSFQFNHLQFFFAKICILYHFHLNYCSPYVIERLTRSEIQFIDYFFICFDLYVVCFPVHYFCGVRTEENSLFTCISKMSWTFKKPNNPINWKGN